MEKRHGMNTVLLRLDFIGQAAAVKVQATDSGGNLACRQTEKTPAHSQDPSLAGDGSGFWAKGEFTVARLTYLTF